ncbi:MAG: VWA domain-containing protein [Candidatus Obscuribacter sp.]|nr:VWA domain-containing protein [Candidatus Obscuribacter sp.]
MSFAYKSRNNKGQSLISLMMIIALVVMPLLAVLSFECARLILAKQELQSASDAAVLTAAATLASADDLNSLQAHKDAIEAALKIFKANTVLGRSLANTKVVASPAAFNCAVGESNVYFEFVNPITLQVEPLTSPNAKVVRVYSCTGSELAFGNFVGIASMAVNALATSAVPKLDMVVCFDVSGSMDDQTPVTLVKRKWDPTLGAGKIVYSPVNSINGPMHGKIFDILKPAATGSSLNAAAPQILTEAYWNAKCYSSEYLAKHYGVPGLRSGGVYPEAGRPPGNYPPGLAPTFDGFNVFTDSVVNIDGQAAFGGFTYNGFDFPDVGTMVEASRGNLESDSLYRASKANTSLHVTPRAGYQKAYLEASAHQIKPMQEAKSALTSMVKILNTDVDAHFGFVAFDSIVGANDNSTESFYDIDDYALYGAKRGFAIPHVVIDSGAAQNKYNDVVSAIDKCVPMGATNIGAAVHAAVTDLKSRSRTGSTRAIVLFTDGEPTVPSGPLSSDPKANARMAAKEARDAGIALYTIGLAQNAAIIPDQTDILNDQNTDPTTGGMAAIAGHGGTFNLVTDSSQLRQTFAKIARRLVRLVAN